MSIDNKRDYVARTVFDLQCRILELGKLITSSEWAPLVQAEFDDLEQACLSLEFMIETLRARRKIQAVA